MHTTSAFLVALTCLAAATPSQGGISPPNLAESWGNGCNTLPYGQTLHRWQQLYEASALPPTLTPGRVITQVGWRRCGSNATYNPATLDIDAGIYNVPLTQATLSGTFATNRSAGTGGTVFVRKLVNLPAMPFGSPTDTFVMLPLDSPHTFAGPGLLLEVVAYGATVVSTAWRNDMCSGASAGASATFAAGCGSTTNTIGSSSAGGSGAYTPGATITITETAGPPNAPAINIFGLSAAYVLGIPLPFNLGFVGAPACNLLASLDAATPITLDAAGAGSVAIAVPPQPSLSGLGFTSQWANIDGAAPGGLGMSAGRRFMLGPIACPMAYVYRLSDNLDTSGTPFTNRGQVMRLVY